MMAPKFEGGPGDSAIIPPGHDAWVVGDEPCVSIGLHWYGRLCKA